MGHLITIAVIGAGPAGSRAAALLAGAGHRVYLVDGRAPWEKPCGGGLTTRALSLDPRVVSQLPHQRIQRITIRHGHRASVSVTPVKPLAVVSRRALACCLIEAATRSGATFVKDRVIDINRRDGTWVIGTRHSSLKADLVIGADGAASLVRRRVSRPFAAEDLSATLGYFIPGQGGPEMKIFFERDLEGYLWSFPRPGHISYGLITRPGPAWAGAARKLLDSYVSEDLGKEALAAAQPYSAPVPSLRESTWSHTALRGEAWALLGDAAGLVDPMTGEGIYYALRSAEILAATLPDLEAFERQLREDCIRELARAARLYEVFYATKFLGGSFRKRLVQLARYSPAIRRHLARLIAGDDHYEGLRERLLMSMPRIACEIVLAPFRQHAA